LAVEITWIMKTPVPRNGGSLVERRRIRYWEISQ
jgi:hypothetical protein